MVGNRPKGRGRPGEKSNLPSVNGRREVQKTFELDPKKAGKSDREPGSDDVLVDGTVDYLIHSWPL